MPHARIVILSVSKRMESKKDLSPDFSSNSLNKHGTSQEITTKIIKGLLQDEKLWYGPSHELSDNNPRIYETCALYKKHYNIYESFRECTKRVLLNH